MKKVISSILAAAVLFLSVGFTTSTHYCGGKKIETKLSFGKAYVTCGMEPNEGAFSKSETIKTDCCKNVYQKYQLEDEFFEYAKTFVSLDSDVFLAFVKSSFSFHLFGGPDRIEYLNYTPPLIKPNRSILFQVFRI